MIYFLSLVGLVAFAISGVLASKDKRPDFIGGFILAFVTSLGGGICRDAILGRPAESFRDVNNFLVIFIAALVGMIFLKHIEKHNKKLALFDAIGLGVFNGTGFLLGFEFTEFPVISAILLGAVTGTGGGVTRDILCNRMPYLLRPGEFYITPCFIGGGIGVALHYFGCSAEVIVVGISVSTILLRLLGLKYNWSFPSYYKNEE
ncbi:MAG: trimeric intracellular cation channel family protein [Rhodothermaceae bacterium]